MRKDNGAKHMLALAWSLALVPVIGNGDATPPNGVPDDLGLQLASPVNDLFTLSSDFSFRGFQGDLPGAGDMDEFSYLLTVAWPVARDSGRQLTVRAYVPISAGTPTYVTPDREYQEFLIRQEADTLPQDQSFINGHSHLDDVAFDVTWGRVSETGFISMYGIATVMPVSQDGSIERDQYLLGPEIAFGQYTRNGVIGAWLTHLVDVADVPEDPPIYYDTNETRIRVFFAHNLANGWQLVSNPTIVYDWEGAGGNKWLVPVGGGVARTTRLWSVPMRFSLEAQYFVESPEAFGPEWMVNLNFTPVLRHTP